MRALLVGIISITLASCATIMHGSGQEVGISSNPSNATVTINGQSYGQTPTVADLKRKNNHTIEIALDGYETYETNLTRSTSGWVWGNIIFGGIPGLAIDAISGGLYKLTPNQIEAEMREGSTASMEKDMLIVKVVLQPDPEWEKVGELTKK